MIYRDRLLKLCNEHKKIMPAQSLANVIQNLKSEEANLAKAIDKLGQERKKYDKAMEEYQKEYQKLDAVIQKEREKIDALRKRSIAEFGDEAARTMEMHRDVAETMRTIAAYEGQVMEATRKDKALNQQFKMLVSAFKKEVKEVSLGLLE